MKEIGLRLAKMKRFLEVTHPEFQHNCDVSVVCLSTSHWLIITLLQAGIQYNLKSEHVFLFYLVETKLLIHSEDN